MSLTITIYAWWVVAYFALGFALLIPLNLTAQRGVVHPEFKGLAAIYRFYRRNPWWYPVAFAATWPVALWDEVTR